MTQHHDPRAEVSSGNPWYTDDQFAKQYRRPGPRAVIENRWNVFESAIGEYFASLAPSAAPAHILDAGCGDGINLFGLDKIIRANGWNASLYGVDYNELRVARALKVATVAEIRTASLTALPYDDGYFQVILCNQVLEHVRQDKAVLEELRRVLRPGGILIVGVPNEGCALAWVRNHVLQRSILRTTDHVNFYTKETLSELLAAAEFKTCKLHPVGFFSPHLAAHYVISHFAAGRWLMKAMGKLWPSQCAELLAVAKRP